ncbi:MAG: hypothetical protein Q8K46_02095, partial [Deltaproteobacteria bacterium]|nr:hypothetical protein [Deltaproteobacteria bacterium]
LDYYLAAGFTLIELGDAEELWENERFDQIYITHTSIYKRLAAFHTSDPRQTRYIKIWGNHDLHWQKNEATLRQLFPGIIVYEAALLDGHILLWHGHQADPSCTGIGARFSKFFVRRFWTALQRCGFRDPTRTANNPGRCNKVDETQHDWAISGFPDSAGFPGSKIDRIIAGHTHRPVYENLSLTERMNLESNMGTRGIRHKLHADQAYYNAGSCVHPRCITGIEITPGQEGKPFFTLIKWGYAAQQEAKLEEYGLTIKREILEPS